MPNRLSDALVLAENVRFGGDTLRRETDGEESRINSIRALFYQNGLKITPEVTPRLQERLSKVCQKLHIPQDAVEGFVYASPDIQAECFAGGASECVIRITSSLVDILEEEELDFVLGHELGHFLLGHGVARMERHKECLEFFMQQRSKEISADRIGLLACDALETAVKALIKTVSGLSGQHLRFDVGTFVSQIRKASLRSNELATHPSILVRCRALLWFSMDDSFVKKGDTFPKGQIEKLDEQVQRDLDKYVDNLAKKSIQEAKDDLAMWSAAYKVVQDGVFSASEQKIFSERFGAETLEKLLNFLTGIPASEVVDVVFEKMNISREKLESLIPSAFEDEYSKIRSWCEASFV